MENTETQNGKVKLFTKGLFALSEEKEDFAKACREWYFDFMDKSSEHRTVCQCKNKPAHRCLCSTCILDLYNIKNRLNGNEAEIGSSCIKYISHHNHEFKRENNPILDESLKACSRKTNWKTALIHFIQHHCLDAYTSEMFDDVRFGKQTLSENQKRFILKNIAACTVCKHVEIHRKCVQSLKNKCE